RHAAADAGIAIDGGVHRIGALHLRVGLARVKRRADAEATFDAGDPRGLGEVALLIEDRVVEADREPIDATARGARERNLEDLRAAGILKALRIGRRAVEVTERARVAQDDGQAEDDREV